MFSKKEGLQLRTEFWIAFGKSFPRTWILYNTKIKDFSFKFYADNKIAEVSLNIAMKDCSLRKKYTEKLLSLETILRNEFLPDIIIEDTYTLETKTEICKLYVQLENVSIYNKNTWRDIFEFFVKNMTAFENFFIEYEDYIKDV